MVRSRRCPALSSRQPTLVPARVVPPIAFNRVLEAVARLRTTAHLGMHREADMISPPTAPDSANETKLDAAVWLKLKICKMELETLKRLAANSLQRNKKCFRQIGTTRLPAIEGQRYRRCRAGAPIHRCRRAYTQVF